MSISDNMGIPAVRESKIRRDSLQSPCQAIMKEVKVQKEKVTYLSWEKSLNTKGLLTAISRLSTVHNSSIKIRSQIQEELDNA